MTTAISSADLTRQFPTEQIEAKPEIVETSEDVSRIELKKRRAIEDGKCYRALVARVDVQARRLNGLPTERSGIDELPPTFDPDLLPKQAARMQMFSDTLQELGTLVQTADKAIDLFDGSARALVDEKSALDDITHKDLYDKVNAGLDELENDWLDHYRQALQKYIEFFSEFNKIMAELHKHITVHDDGKKVNINFVQITRQLDALMAKYAGADGQLASFSSEADAKKFIDSLGVTGLVIEQSGGKWHVKYDLQPVRDLRGSTGGDIVIDWDMAKYNAWQSAKDSHVESLQYVSKVLGEKNSRNLQIFDSVVKALSSLIESIGQADRDVISNFS